MATQKTKKSALQIGGTVLGTAAGALLAGPAGALAGAALGSTIGTTAGGIAGSLLPEDQIRNKKSLMLGPGDPEAGYREGELGKDFSFNERFVEPKGSGALDAIATTLPTAISLGTGALNKGTEGINAVSNNQDAINSQLVTEGIDKNLKFPLGTSFDNQVGNTDELLSVPNTVDKINSKLEAQKKVQYRLKNPNNRYAINSLYGNNPNLNQFK